MGNDSVVAVERALDVLVCFQSGHEHQTPAELTARWGAEHLWLNTVCGPPQR